MTDEEYFRKNYPNFCYGDRPLSPYWDFFQDGVEFGERQSEKKIEELERENAELKARLNAINLLTPELEKMSKAKTQQLTKAKEIILKLYNAGRDVLMCRAEEKAYDNLDNAINDRSIEQFLKEIEK